MKISYTFSTHDMTHLGNTALYALHKILKSKIIDKKIKVTVYKTLIKPVVTYGCEMWTITKKLEEMLDTFESFKDYIWASKGRSRMVDKAQS